MSEGNKPDLLKEAEWYLDHHNRGIAFLRPEFVAAIAAEKERRDAWAMLYEASEQYIIGHNTSPAAVKASLERVRKLI